MDLRTQRLNFKQPFSPVRLPGGVLMCQIEHNFGRSVLHIPQEFDRIFVRAKIAHTHTHTTNQVNFLR